MPKRSSIKKPTIKKPKDVNQIAWEILSATTSEGLPEPKPQAKAKVPKNPHAQALGRLGGIKGGKARAKVLTAKQRTEIAKKAAKARWKKKRTSGS